MTKKITIDFETRGTCDLVKCGVWKYAAHPDTDVICTAVKEEGAVSKIWMAPKFRHKEVLDGIAKEVGRNRILMDEEFTGTVEGADIIEAHNAEFERALWHHVMYKKYFIGFDLPLRKVRCSAAKAAMHSIPRSLAGAGAAMGLATQKDQEGHALMLKMCKPRKPRKAEREADPDWEKKIYWHEETEQLVRLATYCLRDVDSEECLSDSLNDLPPDEQELWFLDQIINQRGIYIDLKSTESIITSLDAYSAACLKAFQKLTNDEVKTPKQIAALKKHLSGYGVHMDSLDKEHVAKALSDPNLPEMPRKILTMRQKLGMSSVSKFDALVRNACDDSRARGTLMYHGAGTGRWTGKGIQLHNVPRGKFKDTEDCIKLLADGKLDTVQMLYGDLMEAASTCIRPQLCAAPGKILICNDYNAIEGRVRNWIAGETTGLQVYKDGKSPYKVAAMSIYHIDYDSVNGDQRQVGKVADLALGYGGGVNAFATMASNYGVNLPEAEVEQIKLAWRDSNPMTVRFWNEVERAAKQALQRPGSTTQYRGIKFGVRNGFLLCRLPSGRCLFYRSPRIEPRKTSWGAVKDTITYMTVDPESKRWVRTGTYGGKLTENIVQAIARDLLAFGMFNVENAGYPIVLHVHDEVVSEVDEGFGSVEEHGALLVKSPDWAEGLPLEAEGWIGKRYRK